jgi:hypothetical protein
MTGADVATAGVLALVVGIPATVGVAAVVGAPHHVARLTSRPTPALKLPPPASHPYSLAAARKLGVCGAKLPLTARITPAGLVISACDQTGPLRTAHVR